MSISIIFFDIVYIGCRYERDAMTPRKLYQLLIDGLELWQVWMALKLNIKVVPEQTHVSFKDDLGFFWLIVTKQRAK
jgi:hypothetical protein